MAGNDLIFKDASEDIKTPNPYQPTSLQYKRAVGLLTGLIEGIREAYEGEEHNEKLVAHIDTVLEQVKEELSGKE
jgi:hypothetical protein